MAEKFPNPKNIAYTITSGFYPELASSIKWGKSRASPKGPVGANYHEKRGFANSSIRRIKAEGQRESEGKSRIPSAFQTTYPKLISGKRGGTGKDKPVYEMTTKRGAEKGTAFLKRSSSAGTHLGKYFSPGQRISTTLGEGEAFNTDGDVYEEASQADEKLEKISYSKWMGGSELYRLYGAKVWHLHGKRERKSISNTLASWANAVTEADTGALPENYLNEIYDRSEPRLIKLASQMAEEVFGEMIEEGNLQKDLETTSEKVEVAEEDVKEAQKALAEDKKGFARHSDKEVDKRSHAQRLDALTETKEGLDLYLDSTEKAITEDEGHGVLSATQELKDAVAGLKDPEDETQIAQLKQNVIKLFINNIKNDFNPIIGHLKKFMNKGKDTAKKQEADSFKKLLDAVEDERKKVQKEGLRAKKMGQPPEKGKGPHISVQNIASAANIAYGKTTTLHKGGSNTQEQAMKYVIHMLASLGTQQGDLFRQGHRVATWEDGSSTYASVPMGISPNTMLFYLNGLQRSPQGTTILTGASHLLALAVAAGAMDKGKQYEVNQRQSQALSRSRIHHHKTNNESRARISAVQDVQRKCHRTTVVSYSPKGLGELMEEVMGLFFSKEKGGKGSTRRGIETVLPNIQANMMKYAHSWPDVSVSSIRKKGSISGKPHLTQTGMKRANRFWALPYIGINDNIYRGKGSMKTKQAGGGRGAKTAQ